VIKVNVRHQGHGNHGRQIPQGFGGLNVGNGKTKQGAAHLFKLPDSFHHSIPGLAFQIRKTEAVLPHGLNNHGRSASDCDRFDVLKAANLYASCAAGHL
jgi:hypothetical protein